MDIDPLQESVPPRYAIESDEEEDEFNPLSIASSAAKAKAPPEIKIIGEFKPGADLIFASSEAGKVWGTGADLGEQIGAAYVNNNQVGLIFSPPWTSINIVVSESFSRVPLGVMHPYAEKIIEAFKPKRVSMLDSYALPTYTSPTPQSFEKAPIRYLTTGTSNDVAYLKGKAEPFSSPNMISSVPASILTILTISATLATLLLLPSRHIPPPAPKEVTPFTIPRSEDDPAEAEDWPLERMQQAHGLIFAAFGVEPERGWKPPIRAKATSSRKRSDIGEGGMYI
ncbi:hypothetical protein CVT24_005618 [Panaeolus cyanescens]|uniref:Uncharacterized protein n=1 Tax=Panaeolus cyanescens TaxID=181874 RepID=A0A409YY11_9AGAR|nr:hypothetical protein CVT24_005618 [Panaeolus cyanescens]